MIERFNVGRAISQLPSDGSAANDAAKDGVPSSEKGLGAGQVPLDDLLPNRCAADGNAIHKDFLDDIDPETELPAEPPEKRERATASLAESETRPNNYSRCPELVTEDLQDKICR